jgi:eukaryotic-like serine/threonine-protein kinase
MALSQAEPSSGITPNRWAQIQEIFHGAIECGGDSRRAYLDRACANDPQLRGELDSLLAVEHPARGFLTSLTNGVVDSLLGTFGPPDFSGNQRFEIRRKIGSGGFGNVYEAFDREGNAVVALKTLPDLSAPRLARFKNEFRALADLYHPNLVTLYELISDREQWFFTMELVSGTNFRDYARECGLAKLRDALRQLVDGVRALHQAGKLHCDLKPSNVLVTPEGRIVILDFGLVTEIDASPTKRQHTVAGTPLYMAPEQIGGARPSEAADWYSLGIMLYEALTGRPPFTGRTEDIIAQKQTLESASLDASLSDVPDDLAVSCRDLLQRDPSLRPSGNELRVRFGAPSRFAPGHFFRGRAEEMNVLAEAFNTVKNGQTAAIQVQGDSGIGKTALVIHFLEGLRRREDVVILEGRCHERELVPYKALDSLVDDLRDYLAGLSARQRETVLPENIAELARLFPTLLTIIPPQRRTATNFSDPHAVRVLAFTVMRELIGRIAASKPVVFFIDDLQWGDQDSGMLLAELMRDPNAPPMLLIGCCRNEASAPILKAFGPYQRLLTIRELGSDQTRDLAIALLGFGYDESASLVDSIARASRGNPFLLHRLATYVRRDSHVWLREEVPMVESVIGSVVAGLPAETRRLLEVVSLAARPIRIEVARQAADLSGNMHLVLAPLRGERLIRISPVAGAREIEPYHDRIRQSVINLLDADQSRFHHRNLAFALESSADCETLAVHFQAAGISEKTCEYAAKAGDQGSGALAFDNAARWYRLALELLPTNDVATRFALRVKCGDALSNAGRGSEGAGEYLLAAEQTSGLEALELQRRAATQYLVSGHMDRGLAVLDKVLRSVGMKFAATPRRVLMSLIARRALLRLRGLQFKVRDERRIPARDLIRIDACWSVAQGLGFVDAMRAAQFHASHLFYALRAGEKYRIARALAVEAGYSAFAGMRNRKKTQKLVGSAMQLAQTCGHPHAVPLVTLISGISAFLEGRWREAIEFHHRAETLLKQHCAGAAWELATARIMSGAALYFRGELRLLCDQLPVLLHNADARGDLYEATALRTRLVHLTSLCADDPAGAAEHVRGAIAKWPGRGFQTQHWWCLVAEAQTMLYAELSRRALDLWTAAWPKMRRSGILRLQYIRIESLYERASSALAAASVPGTPASDCKRFVGIAKTDARRIRKENAPWADGLAALIEAGVNHCSGRRERTSGLLQAAQSAFEQAGMMLFAAIAQRRRGEVIGGDRGFALVESSDAWMTSQNICRPDRMSAMLAPGEWRGKLRHDGAS